jgi:hypothetical protein
MSRAVVVVVLVLLGCQSPAAIGASCTHSSDCSSSLVCAFGRCRAQCVAARDCPGDDVCLAPSGTAGVCEIPTIDVCSLGACDAPLICASGHCRQACTSASDCPAGHTCNAGACVRADVDAGASDASAVDAHASDAGWACDPIANTGCASTRRCGLISGTPTCVAIGSAMLGASCASETACGIGLSCQAGRCVQICYAGDDASCGTDRVCDEAYVEGDLPAPGISLCTALCDPLAATSCGAGHECALGVTTGDRAFTYCTTAGTATDGVACNTQADCAPTFECGYGLGSGCRALCDPTAPSCAAHSCRSVFNLATRVFGLCDM